MKIYQTVFIAFLTLAFTACNAPQPIASPTETFRKFVEASQKKDVETMKQTLSAGTLKMVELSAQKENITLDEALKKDDGNAPKEIPETRNEKIEGDTATVEVKNPIGDFDRIPFVKEDGKWKLAIDKFIADLQMKMNAPEVKTMPMESVPDDGKSATETNKKP